MTAKHQYPGINLDLKDPCIRGRGSPKWLYKCPDYDKILLPMREVFMMTLMDRLTDKPEWDKKVFDEYIVSKWRDEAFSCSEKPLFDEIVSKSRKGFYGEEDEAGRPVSFHNKYELVPFPNRLRFISRDAFTYCIDELRAKAAHFKQTGLVPTLDSIGRAIVKSDTIISDSFKSELQTAFEQLHHDQLASNAIDWHPGTNETVQDLVHPSLYHFVYGKSLFIQDEVVGVEDAIHEWAGRGTKAPESSTLANNFGEPPTWLKRPADIKDWSAKYQWLPSNLAFQTDGSVKFTSYINNLHPRKYKNIYRTLEKLVNLAIPAWDQVLVAEGRQRSRFSLPEWTHDDESEGLWEPLNAEILAKSGVELEEIEIGDCAEMNEWFEDGDDCPITPEIIMQHQDDIDQWKWRYIRDAILPEPDNTDVIDYGCKESIREKYKDSGLQVIIKMASIRLTPEKPDYLGGGWHVEGMVNERICATALYYLDSHNITDSYLAFRTETERDQENLNYSASAYNWLERVYGVDFRRDLCLQTYGRIQTREGRMLAFPNVFQHRVTPFSLKDKTKPGHRSFIALWLVIHPEDIFRASFMSLLVDPAQRIVSTANVPPQQLDWWSEATLGETEELFKNGHVAKEDLERLLWNQANEQKSSAKTSTSATQAPPLQEEHHPKHPGDAQAVLENLMSHDEALEHRLHLMAERSVVEAQTNEGVGIDTYMFCEH